MMSQSELVDRFFNEGTSGVASNMEIATAVGGGVVLKGYGHAVYAYRPGDMRFKTVCFTGWKGASSSTNQHIALIEPEAEHCFDGRPSMTDVRHDPDLGVLEGISSNDKDYSGYHDRAVEGRGGV